MSTSAVSSSSIYQELQSFFQQRHADVQQLGKDLAAGNVANAQQDYATLQSLGQSGPSAKGNVFGNRQREQDLNAIGTALQSNNLAGAQQAFAQLESTNQTHHPLPPVSRPPVSVSPPISISPPISVPPAIVGSGGSNSGTEIVLNLANAPAGEQITIGLTNEANGNEKVAISAVNPQNQTPEKITLDVNPNTNQQIILNLFGSPNSTSAQASSLNTTA